MRRIGLALFVVAALMGMAAQAAAQDLACPNFSSDQDAAQAFFEAGGGSATNNYNEMDADGNGVACDEPGAFEGGGPSAGPEADPSAHPTECDEFPDQASAQAFLDVEPRLYSDLQNLDIDENGIACDEPGAFGPGGGPSAHPTECDEFPDQASAQAFLDVKPRLYSDLQNLDIDENGIACDEPGAFGPGGVITSSTDSATGDDSDSPEGESDDSESVTVALPSTGSGSMSEPNPSAVALAGAASALLAGVAMTIRRMAAAGA